MAEEKLPHSARLIQSGGLFSGKKSWQRVMTFRRKEGGVGVGGGPHHNANMEMPAVAES